MDTPSPMLIGPKPKLKWATVAEERGIYTETAYNMKQSIGNERQKTGIPTKNKQHQQTQWRQFLSEINYLKTVTIDKGVSPYIVDQAIKNFSNSSCKIICKYRFQKYCVILSSQKSVSKNVKILKKFDFKTVFAPVNKIT